MAILSAEIKTNEEKPYVLISACLMGCNTRYAGDGKLLSNINELMTKYNLIPICPEQLGGLATPREPSEQRVIDGRIRVINRLGEDVTAQFEKGAAEALHLAQLYGCRLAILKERSPSCGFGQIYDGTFSGHLKEGQGITASLLRDNGIEIIGESSL